MNVHALCEYSASPAGSTLRAGGYEFSRFASTNSDSSVSTIIVQFTQSISYRESLGRQFLGTTEGDNTDDLQGNRKVGRQLRCPSLEYQCKRHQHRKNSDCAERSPENSDT